MIGIRIAQYEHMLAGKKMKKIGRLIVWGWMVEQRSRRGFKGNEKYKGSGKRVKEVKEGGKTEEKK
ncbi:unnamed protein product [Prunus armeniaca]|uniref:Uncharacterized protein n=1 Tax=Prunus armeniaca TaxID=36596 RepID=A0A6J5V2T0_PRUAR|nr:unnamed protein product [Prunus armeniaca]